MTEDLTLKTKLRHVNPRTANQSAFIEAMNSHDMTFGLGPAGTGKTFWLSQKLYPRWRQTRWKELFSHDPRLRQARA